jgi:hypothetical protein
MSRGSSQHNPELSRVLAISHGLIYENLNKFFERYSVRWFGYDAVQTLEAFISLVPYHLIMHYIPVNVLFNVSTAQLRSR